MKFGGRFGGLSLGHKIPFPGNGECRERDAGIGGTPEREHRAVINPGHLEGEIGERQTDGEDRRGDAISLRPRTAGGQKQCRHQHRVEPIAKQDEVDDEAADVVAGQ